ncbi:hypothetical protein C4K26_4599 [Pseudomonas chlororaphis]|nr:hypothetical protein C4K26_4599 [Pseudomonas chlororaphis]
MHIERRQTRKTCVESLSSARRPGYLSGLNQSHPGRVRKIAMSNVQIGLLVLFGISAFGFVTLSIDLWRARRPNKGK